MTEKIKKCLGNLFRKIKKFEPKSVSKRMMKSPGAKAGLPIPTHLKAIMMVEEARFNRTRLKGKIRCTCGCTEIKLKTWPNGTQGELHIREYHDSFALKVLGECTACSKVYELFDASKHGYDGFVCHEYLSAGNRELYDCYCCNCGKDVFSVQVNIIAEDKEQFVEEVVADASDEFRPEDYVNAFGSISMTMRCKNCGREIWMEMETA